MNENLFLEKFDPKNTEYELSVDQIKLLMAIMMRDLKRKEKEMSSEDLEKQEEIQKVNANYHRNLGIIAYEEFNYETAEKQFRIAMQIKPDHTEIYDWYTKFCIANMELEKALEFAQMAVEILPDRTRHKRSYAKALYWAGEYDKALELATKLHNEHCNSSNLLHLRGRIFYEMGDKQNALHNFRLAVEGFESPSMIAFADYMKILIDFKKFNEAKELFNLALEHLNPSYIYRFFLFVSFLFLFLCFVCVSRPFWFVCMCVYVCVCVWVCGNLYEKKKN